MKYSSQESNFGRAPNVNLKVGDLIRGLGFKPTNKDIAEILGNPKKEEMNTSTCNFDQFLGYVKQAGEKQKEGTYEDFVEGEII